MLGGSLKGRSEPGEAIVEKSGGGEERGRGMVGGELRGGGRRWVEIPQGTVGMTRAGGRAGGAGLTAAGTHQGAGVSREEVWIQGDIGVRIEVK